MSMRIRTKSLLLGLATLMLGGVAVAEITATDVKRVMAEHNGEVRKCYEKHAKDQAGATGEVKIDVGVTPAGRVDKVDVEAPGVSGKKFSHCVDVKVKKWKFPESDDGTVVTIPYKFYFADSNS